MNGDQLLRLTLRSARSSSLVLIPNALSTYERSDWGQALAAAVLEAATCTHNFHKTLHPFARDARTA